ncbi:uncharacterized protein LOC131167696 [Malania oleifera]|uniref:uncharacterized protein LOC131167696 n=1 Tax=Malania oleifera TaxID=397392 RepID=UPI0025ADE2FE|nr:uncharacterized protein LOC131167696 [Malania oleifera]
MADKSTGAETEAWGTWEELLLACAVNRYGTNSWDSVAIEMQKRSSTLHLLTPLNCKRKYHDLKRRFMTIDHQTDDVSEGHDQTQTTIPWLDELRKLRVAELKREVERYDLSIVSLQLKVKRLKEERDQSLRENEDKSDLEKCKEDGEDEETKDGDGESDRLLPGCVAGEAVSEEEPDRDNQSSNESNSTDPKCDNPVSVLKPPEEKQIPVVTSAEEPDPTGQSGKRAGEDSCNGSSESMAKESATRNSEKRDSERGSGESPELWESVAESKGGGDGLKESSSDVQSSASLSRKTDDHQAPATKPVSFESQPLIEVLQIIKSHRLGSVFSRRLESQETQGYTSLIRQHIDLETVRTRLEEGWYADCTAKFFRDLLLLFSNAVVFFGRSSSESAAATELRLLISMEMARRTNPKSNSSPEEPAAVAPPASSNPPKPDPEPSDPLPPKPKLSGPIIVCRKRSSLAAKERRREQVATMAAEEKPAASEDLKPKGKINKSSGSNDQESSGITKKRFTSARNSNRSSKSRTNSTANKSSSTNSNAGRSSGDQIGLETRAAAAAAATTSTANAKRRSASNFSSRLNKQTSESNNGSLLETLKGFVGGGSEHKRNGGQKGSEAKKEERRSSGGKQAKEQQSSPGKRIGRPPKRGAAAPSLPPVVPAKRSREAGEAEASGSRQPKKRSRR